VSRTAGRAGDSFISPGEQRQRIEEACERDKLELVRVQEEIDVSGGTALSKRAGLREAIESIEGGEAEVLIVAYFDRLVRSLRVQDEVVSRVEAAGGRVVAIDFGQITGKNASQWLSGTLLGAVSEYARRSAKERSGEAQAVAVERGVVPFPTIPPGYRRGEGGVLVVEPTEAEVVRAAFEARADGATIEQVRGILRAGGVQRTFRGVQGLLASRLVLGEIHFGRLVNPAAHPAIVDRATWDAVQRVRVTRGTRPKSDRLLARLGVLRCASCSARMVVGTAGRTGKYPMYRCPPTGDCRRRVSISARIIEGLVVERVRALLADQEGRASAEARGREAVVAVERAQADLDAAIRAFAGVEGETAARERLAELRAIRDAAEAELEHLGGLPSAITINAAEDWDRLSLDAQRRLIRATLERVEVGPGRGTERVTIVPFGE
jgi:site-specific DNA recombinase